MSSGSDFVYLLVGLEYNREVWKKDWPLIMRNTIDACKASKAKLIFFDNVYMYGRVNGPMTESTPFNPVSEKGRIRAAIDEMLLNEMKGGGLQAIIAKSADFYGPGATKTSVVGMLVFDKMSKSQAPLYLSKGNKPHSYTYTPDAANALYMLAGSETAYGQTWHLPTAHPALTSREFNAIAAKYMNAKDKMMVMPSWLVRTLGLFTRQMKEVGEMLYQNKFLYEFDSSKFEKAFQFQPTAYEQGIKETAESFKK